MGKPKKNQNDVDSLDQAVEESGLQVLSNVGSDVEELEKHPDKIVAVTCDMMPTGIALPCALFVRLGERLVKFRSQGDKLHPKRLLDLRKKGVDALYVHRDAWNVFVEALESVELPPHASADERAQQLRNLLAAYGQELLKKTRDPGPEYFAKLKNCCDLLVQEVSGDPSVANRLLRHSEDPSVYYVNHAVNVAVYCLFLGLKLKLPATRLKELTFAGMVHDVGHLYVPQGILEAPLEALNEESLATFQSHPRRGAELLEHVGAPLSAIAVAFQHQEWFDGSGYPSGLAGKKIHEFARICMVGDVFDSLISHRPGSSSPLSPKAAAERIRGARGRFDPDLVRYLPDESED